MNFGQYIHAVHDYMQAHQDLLTKWYRFTINQNLVITEKKTKNEFKVNCQIFRHETYTGGNTYR